MTPAYVLDEADFRSRARAFREAFADYDVFYAGKAFLCTAVARWIAEEGLNLDVCSPGELTRRARRRLRPRPDRLSRQQQDPSPSCGGPSSPGWAGSSSTPSPRSSGWSRSPATPARQRARDGAGDGGRRGAHARVHRHRPRGPEVRLLDHQRRRRRGGTPRAGRAPDGEWARAARPALPHRQPDLRLLGLRGGGPAGARPAPPGQRGARRHAARARPRRRLRHRVHHPGRPVRPRAARHRAHQDRRARVPRPRHRAAAPVHRAGPGDRRPVDVHPLHRRHRQGGRARRQRAAHLRLRRRRDERQHPHGALRRRLLLHARLAAQRRGADAGARRRQALRGRRHRGEGRVPARRPAPGRPGRGARHRRLLPLDGLQLQPRAAAAGDRGAGRGRDRAAAQGD